MSDDLKKYFIGLDCGTSSVGWAVTDEKYNLLSANGKVKRDGKTKTKPRALWGVRLFDEADTAAERRVARSNRRRLARAKNRLKLLRMLFEEEIAKVDPEFYQRLRESFFLEEDKNLRTGSKNTLFNDANFTDKDFYKLYPTIWHLRQTIVKADADQHFDIRLYFLAIQHILKHRGHFLSEGEMSDGGEEGFAQIFVEFCDVASNYGYHIEESMAEAVKEIIVSKDTKSDKKKRMKDLALFREVEGLDELDGQDDEKRIQKGQKALAEFLVGSSVKLSDIFGLEVEEKETSFSLADNLEEKEDSIVELIGLEGMDLFLAAKRIYDYGVLRNLLGEHRLISDAMVANYKQHQQDLKALKEVFRPHADIYRSLFKTKQFDEKTPSYNAYISKAYDEDKSGRRSTKHVDQETFNKQLKKLLEQIGYQGELLVRAENGQLLPKQRGQAKGTIPQQLHHKELEMILEKLGQDYPSFAVEVPGEDSAYNTKLKKIAEIHSLRIPYYCGPLVKRKIDENGNPVSGGKSQFSWADEEIAALVHPWNFDQLVNKDQRADAFIRRMTNECTYLLGEDVLPKSSLLYQRYMVLNELNNLKLNGQRIDNRLKQQIFADGYLAGQLRGNITLKRLEKWLKESGFIGADDELSGSSVVKILPKLQTYQDFCRILGDGFTKRYTTSQLERVVEAITILGEEKKMLQARIERELGCDVEVAKKLAKLSYKDWGKFSEKFLSGIRAPVDGSNLTILEALWETNCNLMELLGGDYGFAQVIEETNAVKRPASGAKITYDDVKALYCSPAVKRSVWQTVKIVDELVKAEKHAPAKIFLEVTRGEDAKAKGKDTLARKKDLENKLKVVKSEEAKHLLDSLGQHDNRDLQSKKLFLYYSQMGKCAYSGEPINLEELNNTQLYDIDHIYPRSKTKDDSIIRNLVLVNASLNREKTNKYPIDGDIRSRMTPIWRKWLMAGLITKEKYNRLTRASELTTDELGGFIARQIVETSQSVKAIRDLLKNAYPNTEIVMVKAGQVADLRHFLANGVKYRDSNEYKVLPKPEFIKVRELNDFHHAKDAYLNIVVGNVMHSTFTNDPRSWVKRRNGKDYSIRTERIFRDSEEYQTSGGYTTSYPEVKGWDFAESIDLISTTMKRNDILWTRMSYVESGAISDLQIVGKTDKNEGILPIKHSKRLAHIEKYGGYNSMKGAHFALIECVGKKGEMQRRIVQIPQVYRSSIKKYIADKYEDAKIVLPVIPYKALMKIEGFPVHLTGKTSSGLGYYQARQAIFDEYLAADIRNVLKVISKDKALGGKYKISAEKDKIDTAVVTNVVNKMFDKLSIYLSMPSFGGKVPEILENKEKLLKLDVKEQCRVIENLVKIFKCNAELADLSSFVPKAAHTGKPLTSEDIFPRYSSVLLIHQSPTGLYEEIVDLKTVEPQTKDKR